MAVENMIGVYGGTFNPVHYGHLRTALDIQQALGLEQVRLIPCAQPAHREQPDVTAQMRLQMLRLAVGNETGLVVDGRELDRPGPSYMIDTLQSIRAEIGQQALILIMGSDAFRGLNRWHQWQRLFDYAHILVMSRPGNTHEIEAESAFLQAKLIVDQNQLRAAAHGFLLFQEVTRLDISATRIRQLIASGKTPRFLMPDSVIEFINTHELYAGDAKVKICDHI